MTTRPGIDLIRLVDLLGPAGVALLVPPPAGETSVLAGHLHDGTLPRDPGHLVLAIGVHGDDPALLELCTEAAAGGQAAVAVKAHDTDLRPLRAHAAAAGIALLAVPDAVRWADVYSALTAALASGSAVEADDLAEDLFALADSIAGVFGSSVAIEDLSQNVVGYSSLPGQLIDDVRIAGILGRRVPESASSGEQYQQVYATNGVVRFPWTDGERPRAAIAIRAGSLPIGSIWALEEGGVELEAELDPECVRALERGAELAARHLMRAHDAHDPQVRRGRAAFAALLTGQPVGRGDMAQLADSDVLTVSAFAPADAGRRSVEIGRLVARQYRVLRPRSVVSAGEDAVYVLTPGDDHEVARRVAQDVLATVERSVRRTVCGAVSSVYASATELAAARREVDDILRCLRSSGAGTCVAALADVRARLLVLGCAERVADDPRLTHPGLHAMRSYDAGRTYWSTLLTWLDCSCSVPATARVLHVHENTVRYRLGRIPAQFGVDIDSAEVRLAVWLQMRTAELAEGAAGG